MPEALQIERGTVEAVSQETDLLVREGISKPSLDLYLSSVLRQLQGHQATHVYVPRKFTLNEAKALSWAGSLLEGRTVNGTWRRARFTIRPSKDGKDILAHQSQQESAMIFAQSQAIQIGSDVLPLGVVGTHLLSTRVESWDYADDSGSGYLDLVPGENEEYETWLVTSEESIDNTIPGISRRFRRQADEIMQENDELFRRLAR